MMGVVIVSGLAGILQLFVPSYALRLIRRFGAERVGWFIVTAFAFLGLLHLLHLWEPFKSHGAISGATLDFIYGASSVLLLIGMCHMEALCTQRERAVKAQEDLRVVCQAEVQEEMTALSAANAELTQQIALHEQKANALAESEARYRFLFTENPMPIWIVDVNSGRFLIANQSAFRQYGYTETEFMALNIRELLPTDIAAGFLQNLAKPCPEAKSHGVWQNRTKDGKLIHVEVTALDLKNPANPMKLIVSPDVSQRWEREIAFRDALKLDVMTQVTGTIAQPMKQLMTSIEDQTDFILKNPQDSRVPEQLQRISNVAMHGAVLARHLNAVGGQHSVQVQVLELNTLVPNLTGKLQQLVGPRIAVETSFGKFAPPIFGDAGLIEQILVDLAMNARDAMKAGGNLTISTAGVRLDKALIQGQERRGEFVCLKVADNGCGMSTEVQSHAFEPFFTTKKSEGALGLGLAGVQAAVRQQSGWIEFTTEAGAGTEFRMFFPCAPVSARPAPAAAPAVKARKIGTVLLVQSDDRARSLARLALDWNGYRVVEADGADLALILWGGQHASIDLLITDLALPGDISGSDLANRLQEAKPGLPIIITAESAPAENGNGAHFVPKPYTPERLLEAVRGALPRVSANSQ